MIFHENLPKSWHDALKPEFNQPYFRNLAHFLRREAEAGKTVYPPHGQILQALHLTPLSSVRVVILGQDPYHGPKQAHGLSFSVSERVPIPPSLLNIFKELDRDLGIPPADHGCLTHWAQQGVLLLNNVLSVEKGSPASHKGQGWERFTDKIVEVISHQQEPVVFLLWGSHAQRKAAAVPDITARGRHLVLKAPHPSPLSAYRGFLGCGHFSAANRFLESRGVAPIDWALSPSPRLI